MKDIYKGLHDLKAERAVLGSIMLNPGNLVKVVDDLHEEVFHDGMNRIVFRAINKLFMSGNPIDTISVAEAIKSDTSHGFELSAASEVVHMLSEVPYSTNLEYYSKIILEHYQRREIKRMSMILSESVDDKQNTVDDLVSNSLQEISTVNSRKEDGSFMSAIKEIDSRAKEYKEKGGKLFGISTGIPELDEMTDGIQPGQFIGFAAYTSQGKTWDALNIMAHQIQNGRKVCFFSLEMGPRQIATRLASIMTGVSENAIKKGELDSFQQKEVASALKKIVDSGSTIYSNQKLSSIKITIIKEAMVNKPDLFILDYLQIISSGGKKYDVLTETAHYLQNTLMKIGIPMWALSQISNDAASNYNQDMQPFKGSGDIGASVATGIYKKSKHKKDEAGERLKRGIPLESIWTIMKNRDGNRIGNITVYYDPKTNKTMGQDEFEKNYGMQKYLQEVAKMKSEMPLDDEFEEEDLSKAFRKK